MKLEFIQLDKLTVSKTNMRWGKKDPDVSDILPSIRKRGVIQPILVRPGRAPDAFEIVAGRRRFTAALIDAEERRVDGREVEPLPCAILDSGDDADAVEASLIENVARLDADEVTLWATFTRLVKEGRSIEDIGATFCLPDLAVRRVLALGSLLPRIRTMYGKGEIDAASIRHLTMATKRQQTEWLALVDDKKSNAPIGRQLKAWLLGGQSIPVALALFDIEASGLATVADLFGEDRFFTDPDAFWTAQHAAIEERRQAYLADGWGEVVVVPANEYFARYEHDERSKAKGGRVYIDVNASGEVEFHEGYLTRKEARRGTKEGAAPAEKAKRPEISSAAQTYVDLHRHAAVRAALTDRPAVALRLMVAHLLVGSSLWIVRREAQGSRDPATVESIANSAGELQFCACRQAVLALLDMPTDRADLTRSSGWEDDEIVRIFFRLLDLPDDAVMDVIAVAMGETLMAGGTAVEAAGTVIGLDMADWWEADGAFLDLVRDKEVMTEMVAEVAGRKVADANARETGKTLKRIVADHLSGAGGRDKVNGWVPKWLAFPPAAYTARGGVGTVRRARIVAAAREEDDPAPTTPGAGALPGEVGEGEEDAALVPANDVEGEGELIGEEGDGDLGGDVDEAREPLAA